MKTKLIVTLVIVFVISIYSQQRPRYGLDQFDPDRMIAHLTEELNLTDEQVAEIKPILLKTESRLDDLKKKSYDTNREMMEEHRSVMEDNAEKIEELLTDEQIEIFRELREQKPRFQRGDRPELSN